MKLSLISNISKALILSFLFFSCSSDLDFDQVENFKLEPVIVANLAYFNLPVSKIDEAGDGGQIPPDKESFDIFKNKFFKENLKKLEFNFELENTIKRNFELGIVFTDVNNEPLESIYLAVPAYVSGTNIIKYPTETFEGQRLERLKKATQMIFIVKMTDASGANSTGNLKLKSSATVYMEIE